ncbi:MAG: hypothetical protein LC135_07105 [Phycisphaerae bacterium]|nr:hypothetical protein [Phycisphaerae bacterium]MCZ2399622.1 hypothetical protein [Phycisphaerae bacterium]
MIAKVVGDELTLAKPQLPPGAFNPANFSDPEAIGLPTYRAVTVDLATLTVTPVEEELPPEVVFGGSGRGAGSGPLSNADWRATIDPNSGAVVVVELATGSETRHFEGVSDSGYVSLVLLDGDRLVVSVQRTDGAGGALLAVLHLRLGSLLLIDRVATSFGDDGAVLVGGEIVFRGIPSFNPLTQPLSEFLASQTIDAVALDSGLRRTLVTAAGRDAGLGLFADGRRAGWVEWLEDGNGYRVRAVDLDTREVTTVAELELPRDESGNTYVSVLDAGAGGLLIDRVAVERRGTGLAPGDYRETHVVALLTVGGSENAVVTLRREGVFDATPPAGVLTPNYAAVLDSSSGVLTVYDLATGGVRNVRPFP